MRKVCIVFCFLFSSVSIWAQGIDLGVKAGVNFANITDASEYDNRTGFSGGFFAGINFSDKLGIQGDLLYSVQGAEIEKEKIDLNYVNVPIVLKYYLFMGLNLQAGPQFGFLIDDNVKELFSNNIESKSFDTSGIVGIGYDLPLGFRIEGRYNFGFTDVIDGVDGKNNVITLSLGFSIL
tara:strand:+ start:786 stop:1322 length:537 start_codon:yes stop_codon:yes gene_type:complete